MLKCSRSQRSFGAMARRASHTNTTAVSAQHGGVVLLNRTFTISSGSHMSAPALSCVRRHISVRELLQRFNVTFGTYYFIVNECWTIVLTLLFQIGVIDLENIAQLSDYFLGETNFREEFTPTLLNHFAVSTFLALLFAPILLPFCMFTFPMSRWWRGGNWWRAAPAPFLFWRLSISIDTTAGGSSPDDAAEDAADD